MRTHAHNQMDLNDDHAPALRRVIILGATGSVGVQTIEVIEHLNALFERNESPTKFQIVGLSAGSNSVELIKLAKRCDVRELALNLASVDIEQSDLNIRVGDDASARLVEDIECDLVVGAIVGIAGLASVLRALELGIDVALANKEPLVAAGSLVVSAAKKSGASILPLDSEHAGVWQCLRSIIDATSCPPFIVPSSVQRVTLTASGGPFRNQSREQIRHAKIEDALNHPNWTMGAKVTIDSATLMNKALELIEAHWLFGLDADRLGAVIHPQSIVHALVECTDSSVIAQLGAPDMKSPIQHALCFPHRTIGCAPKLNINTLSQLDFFEIDPTRFPAIELAMDAIRKGKSAGAMLNAANEQAVLAFMDNRLDFGRIDECIVTVMSSIDLFPINTIDDVHRADAIAREMIDELCLSNTKTVTKGVR